MSVEIFRTGFVALVGPTNAGKSTLMNGLVGEKISIVSKKTQTTYHGIRGILNRPTSQIIFVDTPGFQNFSERVSQLLNRVADKNALECDVIVWVFDVTGRGFRRQIEALQSRIEASARTIKPILVLNKIDQIPKPTLLPLLAEFSKQNLFSEIIPVSALRKKGLDSLLKSIESYLPEAPALFPTEMVTDRNEQFLVAEMIREKIYHETFDEIPYATWIEIEDWQNEGSGGCPHIHARIHVDADSKQGILIGKQGQRLKAIGMSARKDIEHLLGKKVFLKLHVDVKKDWKRDSNFVGRYLELT